MKTTKASKLKLLDDLFSWSLAHSFHVLYLHWQTLQTKAKKTPTTIQQRSRFNPKEISSITILNLGMKQESISTSQPKHIQTHGCISVLFCGSYLALLLFFE